MKKRAGVLCPLFSVPANQGIGDLGQKTIRMIDAVAAAGFSIWQILPLKMTGMTHSPYQTLSSFAGDPIYINIDRLAEMGLLTQSSIVNCNKFKDYVSYDEVRQFKEPYFRRAFRNFKKRYEEFRKEFEEFEEEAFWLEDWAVYSLFKGMYDLRAWTEWEEEYRDWPLDPTNIELDDYQDEILYHKFLQWLFDRQLREVAAHAREKGLALMGDIQFYPAYDSADIWADRDQYMVEPDGRMIYEAGLAPDEEHPEGQKWGMPTYDFAKQKKNGFRVWRQRIAWMARYFDIIRIGNFRAMDTYWRIPAGKPARDGKWILGPRGPLMEAILESADGREIVAEDLGMPRPEVAELRDSYNVQGMDVLQYRMDTKALKKPDKPNSFLYTGNHDNATLEEQYSGFDQNRRIGLRRFFKKRGYNLRAFHDMVCKYVLDSEAETVILPIQDICGYKGKTRVNVPGSDDPENWTWKLKDFKTFPQDLMKMKPWIEESGRLPE